MALFFTPDTHFGDHRTINIHRRPFANMGEIDAALISGVDARDFRPATLAALLDGIRPMSGNPYPATPDGRYFIVRGRLWRRADPSLPEARRASLVARLMAARRAVGAALRQDDLSALAVARAEVDQAKTALGERGPVWWGDGAPDLNRHMAANTIYAEWFAQLEQT